jgi:ABC-2 type transport system ATP-binding protein
MSYEIKVNGVSKSFKTVQALNDVRIIFDCSKMHGIVGPEGAGKTTLMRMLAGLLNPDNGSIEYIENNIPISLDEVRNHIAYMPQQQSLYADLSIEEHLNFFKALYDLEDEEFEYKKNNLLKITRLEKFVERQAGKLSGGMYKKLGLMCSLLRSPKILLLDEPTNGVDPISRREFWELLYNLMDDKILILTTTAYMDEAERCSVVHVFQNGKSFCSGDPSQLIANNSAKNFEDLFRIITGDNTND